MDTKFTIIWLAWIIIGGVIEGIALFNSTRGDTLSEHLWAWLGVRTDGWAFPPPRPAHLSAAITPRWTLRVARTLFIFAMVWFTLHIATGGWV